MNISIDLTNEEIELLRSMFRAYDVILDGMKIAGDGCIEVPFDSNALFDLANKLGIEYYY